MFRRDLSYTHGLQRPVVDNGEDQSMLAQYMIPEEEAVSSAPHQLHQQQHQHQVQHQVQHSHMHR